MHSKHALFFAACSTQVCKKNAIREVSKGVTPNFLCVVLQHGSKNLVDVVLCFMICLSATDSLLCYSLLGDRPSVTMYTKQREKVKKWPLNCDTFLIGPQILLSYI